jgi:phage anti-repressor protein
MELTNNKSVLIMKNGSEKQIKWALDVQKQYTDILNRVLECYESGDIECDLKPLSLYNAREIADEIKSSFRSAMQTVGFYNNEYFLDFNKGLEAIEYVKIMINEINDIDDALVFIKQFYNMPLPKRAISVNYKHFLRRGFGEYDFKNSYPVLKSLIERYNLQITQQ